MNSRQPNGRKKSRGFWRVLFSRVTVIILMLLFQLALFGLVYVRLRDEFTNIYTILQLAGVGVIIYVMNRRDKPEFKIAWIIPMLVIPVFGTLLYVYMKTELSTHALRRELARTHEEVSPFTRQDPEVLENLRKSNPSGANLAYYLGHSVGYPAYQNTRAHYYPSGESMYKAMLRELKKARHFIFMEYFIVAEGEVWGSILDILAEKVQEGVEVRFLYDGMCVINHLSYRYPKYLRSFGIQTKMFSPLRPVLSTYQNNRDHRKICVIDGEVGFTGGINLADEYVNRVEKFGHWKDTGVILRGDAVQNLTMMFLEMWNVGEKRKEDYTRYLTKRSETPVDGGGYVTPFGDSPFDREEVGERVYLHILEHAKKYVHIMTPYLVLDSEFLSHLTYAAKSGIEVSIIMPHIPDKPFAFALAKTYYRELIEAGVRIYEYEPGFVHAKMFVSDDETAVVGTINLDYRSLYLHFECAALLYRNMAVRDVEADYQETLKHCRQISVMDLNNLSVFMKLTGKVLRLFAPLI